MIVIDSSVWISLDRGHDTAEVRWLLDNLTAEEFATTDLSVCEVLQGARSTREFRHMQSMLQTVPILTTGGVDLAIDAAERYARLRSRGITIRNTLDCLLATFCIREGHRLLHADRDFSHFERHFGLHGIKTARG